MKKSILPLFLLFSATANAHLLISEVLYDTPGNDSVEEWVELYNPDCSVVELNGYSLSDNSSTFNLSGTINAGAYLVVAKNASGFYNMYGASPDISGMTLALGNGGDWVELSHNNATVDQVAWESALSGWNISARYTSIYRTSSNDHDTVSDWAVSGTDTPKSGPLSQTCGDDSGNGGNDGGSGGSTSHADYYAAALGLSGAALKSALHNIISSGYTRLSYSQVWTALQYTDEDPGNSNNVILIYTGRSASKSDRVGQPGADSDSWNREHLWAKSLGFPSSNQYGYTDIHHLRPADETVNSLRGNKDFDNGGSVVSEAPGNYTDSDSFEPRNAVKGDVARSLFYMAVRYDGSDGSMPDLELANDTSSSTGDPEIGVLCTLYQWHSDDPVDSFEQRRNDRVQEWQGNRNPFIDNPQWVQSIWGNRCH